MRKEALVISVILVMFLLIAVFTLTGAGYYAMSGNTAEESSDNQVVAETVSENVVEEESSQKLPDYLDYFNSANIYDYVDPDTGVHYLVFRDSNYQSGRGGITPRLNSDGTLMVEELEE